MNGHLHLSVMTLATLAPMVIIIAAIWRLVSLRIASSSSTHAQALGSAMGAIL